MVGDGVDGEVAAADDGAHDSEIGRGHLRDPSDRSFTIYRYEPAPSSFPWLRIFWIPVWAVPRNEVREQRVLTYPVCLLSITAAYARLVGPRTTAARTPLAGRGWAFGAMLTPGTGRTVLGADVSTLVDGHVDLAEIPLLADLVPLIRSAMRANPARPAAHHTARELVEQRFTALAPPAGDAALIGQIVRRVEQDTHITAVGSLCRAFGLQERTLQRLCGRFLGVPPLWLIRQRRLQDAGRELRRGSAPLSELALRLGYADQAHFSRDFRRATGWTPGEFAALALVDGIPEDGTAHPGSAGRHGSG